MNLSLKQNARGVSIGLDAARELSGKLLLQQGIQDATSTRLLLRNYSRRGIGIQALHLALRAARSSSTVIRYLLVCQNTTLARSQRWATFTRPHLIVSLATNKVLGGYLDTSKIAIEFEALDQRLH
jgi:hypothetical protein